MRFFIALLILSMAVAAPCLAVADESATRRAITEYNGENYEEALQLLLDARGVEGRTSLNDYYTGLCQKETGSYADSVESFTGAVQGTPPVKDAAVELVAALVNLDRNEDAMRWVSWAEKEQVKPSEIAYLKGLILTKQKRHAEAIAAFNAAKTGNKENDQQADLQIAVAYAQQGKTQEARQSLKAIITRYPGTDVAEFATEYDQKISQAAVVKRWNFFAGFNYQYDDNVTLKSKVSGASNDTRNEKNSGFNENLRFEYDAPLEGKWSTNLQYFLQNNNYTRLHEFNMLAHGFTGSLIHRDDTLLFSLPLNVTHTTLDYRSYSLQMSLRPTETIVFAPQHLGQVSLGYSRRELYQSANLLPINNRDANIFSGQLAYILLYADGLGMFNLRSELFYEDADGSDWRNLGSRAGVDLLVPVCKGTKLILTSEGTWQDYRDSAAGRKDTIFTGSATINRHLFDNLYMNLQYAYTRAMSNVDLYDYQRNVASAGIELRF